MKERAEASERLSQQIIASLTSGLLVVGDDRIVRTLNPAGRRMLGIAGRPEGHSMDEVLGTATPLAAVVEECLPIRQRAVIRRTLQTGLPGGGTAHLGVTVSPIRDGGSHQGAICLFSDLSDVVELEEQLRFKDSLARLGELTAGIAHEFRNGLATIHGYSRLLDLEKLPADYQAVRPGDPRRDRGTATGRHELLELRETGRTDAEPGRPQRDRGTRGRRSSRGSRAAWWRRRRSQGSSAPCRETRSCCARRFSNLVRNALEACSDAGIPPRIQIEGAVDRALSLQQMTISDNGPGVDANVTARMFRPFFTTKARGTGLGLALVQKIVVTHNGRVTVANGESGGARITVTLPLDPN